MSNPICPSCQNTGRFLEASSSHAYVEYYRCDLCGHVWHYAKHDPNARAISITETVDSAIRHHPRAA
jgi:uncharacterized Zn finger protein